MLGERSFLIGVQLLTIDKRMYISDEEILAQTSNFNLFIHGNQQNSKANIN